MRRTARISSSISRGEHREATLGGEALHLRDGRQSPYPAKGREGLFQLFFPHGSEDCYRMAANGDHPFLLGHKIAEGTLRFPL